MNDKTGSVVYVVNSAGHNIEAAKAYGELCILSKDKLNVFSTDRITTDFTEKMKDFNPKKDYILTSGSIILNILAYKIAMSKGAKNVKLLLYHFHHEKYIVRDI